MGRGRPEIFTQDIADRICHQLMDGKSLRSICIAEDMPERTTVHLWLHKKPDFFNQYTHAREIQAETLFDECSDIADDGSNDYRKIETNSGKKEIFDHEHVSRSKLRIDTRMAMIKRLAPKKYSDKQEIDLNIKGIELIPPVKPAKDES